jgi:SAM-dependent methyltransferase
MDGTDRKAPQPGMNSILRPSTGEQLIKRLGIPIDSDILYVRCGTGETTAELVKLTSGRVTGIDPSAALINRAKELYSCERMVFLEMDEETIPFEGEFDAIYCNAAFHWFRNPAEFLEKAKKALRPNGKIGIHVPAKNTYSPLFTEAVEECCSDPDILRICSGFRPPWLMFGTISAFRLLFCSAGFTVSQCFLEKNTTHHSPDVVFEMFKRVAERGYLNPECYDTPFPDDFKSGFLSSFKKSIFRKVNEDGMVELLTWQVLIIAER